MKNLYKNKEFKPGFYHNKLYELAKQRFYIHMDKNKSMIKIKSNTKNKLRTNKNKLRTNKSNISNYKNKSRKIKNKF